MDQIIAGRHSIPTSKQFENPELARLVLPSTTAWPTLLLFFFVLTGWTLSSYYGIKGWIPITLSIALNTFFAYLSFTVMHDASHRAISSRKWVNNTAGRISILPLLPLPVFRLFRFAHMQHHRFANESYTKDPDTWTSSGHPYSYLFRWATIDLYYLYYYFSRLNQRPEDERNEVLLGVAVGVGGIVGIIISGHLADFLLLWVLPGRIAIIFLAFAFDYLPHIPKKTTQRENPFQATNNRIGLEFIMTPIFLYQNYHLIHHLYPRVPFYRYTRIWHLGKDEFKKRGALLLDWKGVEL